MKKKRQPRPKPSNPSLFIDRTIRYASLRPRSRKEISDYLKRKESTEEETTAIFNLLEKLELVDDLEFTKWWIDQRQTFKKKGKRLITFELLQKGIAKEVIEKAFGQVELIDERSLAVDAASKKFNTYKNLPIPQIRLKIMQFLQRKGFSLDVIRSVVDELIKKEYNT